MRCIRCEEEARAVCQFCGWAVYREHLEEARFVSGFTSKAGWWSTAPNTVAVEDTVWCGVCHPEFKGTACPRWAASPGSRLAEWHKIKRQSLVATGGETYLRMPVACGRGPASILHAEPTGAVAVHHECLWHPQPTSAAPLMP